MVNHAVPLVRLSPTTNKVNQPVSIYSGWDLEVLEVLDVPLTVNTSKNPPSRCVSGGLTSGCASGGEH